MSNVETEAGRYCIEFVSADCGTFQVCAMDFSAKKIDEGFGLFGAKTDLIFFLIYLMKNVILRRKKINEICLLVAHLVRSMFKRGSFL